MPKPSESAVRQFLLLLGCSNAENGFIQAEVQAECRIDHYQTLQQVCVTVFAKQVDKSRSSIVIDAEKV